MGSTTRSNPGPHPDLSSSTSCRQLSWLSTRETGTLERAARAGKSPAPTAA